MAGDEATDWRSALSDAAADGRVLKAHGTGNDFIVVVDPDDVVRLDKAAVVALCDRHRGIGADGVIRMGAAVPRDVPASIAAELGQQDVFMDYRNADGGIVEMCGNGVRVVAAVADRMWPTSVAMPDRDPTGDDVRIAIGTRAGMRPVVLDRTSSPVTVTVDMGLAAHGPAAVHLDESAMRPCFELPPGPQRCMVDVAVDGGTRSVRFQAVSMGNPHAVVTVPDVDAVDLAALGPAIEGHPAFTRGVNVNIVEVVGPSRVRLRVWERGVGETLACGTGACATIAALELSEGIDASAPVRLAIRGGELDVWRDDDDHMVLRGPAQVVATIQPDSDWLRDVVA